MAILFLVFLSVIQGVSELFPVSSLGHTLLIPAWFWIRIDAHVPQVLPFLVALHLGTALALLYYFRARWCRLIRGWFSAFRHGQNEESQMMWALIVGTMPAGCIGLLFEKQIAHLFEDLRIVAIALMVNGLLLMRADRLPPKQQTEKLTLLRAFWVGLAQVGALIPGFSRSGLTMIAARKVGLKMEKAAEFSFLLGTPIILAAGVLELPKLFHVKGQLAYALLGGILTAGAAYLSVRFLMTYFKDQGQLATFGWYCVVFGAASLVWFFIHPTLS